MFFATWEFFNPFLKNDALFTTGCLHSPAHVPLQRSVPGPPRPAPRHLRASHELAAFERCGDPWISGSPGAGFLLIRFAAFLIRVRSSIARAVNRWGLAIASPKVSVNVSGGGGGWDYLERAFPDTLLGVPPQAWQNLSSV